MQIKVDTKEVDKLERQLNWLNLLGVKFAQRETMNDLARVTMKRSKQIIKRDMIQRNRFTLGSIRMNFATRARDFSEVGSLQKYMITQEHGTTEQAGGKHGVAIPTRFSSGEGKGSGPRRKLVRRPNRMHAINIPKGRRRGKNKAQRRILAIARARSIGAKYAFLEFKRTKGIFRVFKRKSRRPMMVQDLTRKTIRIPASPWLRPAREQVTRFTMKWFRKNLIKQIRRNTSRHAVTFR